VGEHRAVAGERSPVERVLDLFVFAPLGLAATAREEVPRLAETGRNHVERQLRTARLVGEFTVRRVRRRADAVLAELGLTPAPRPAAFTATSASPSGGDVATRAAGDGQSAREPVAAPSRPNPDQLAIPGYDSLSASQVVQRLTGLSRAELEAVRAYEVAGRGRKTILAKVAQLQAAAG
jgi:hypothetical protein